ncbi:hypothetical protein BC938DRAFT_477886 [Jimgerdemannia flammicorona]|uniref:Uncharacterized protein n=1 Tax=Jimgerdemannia flammicorona TaxID=994334 RepID=A0A433QNP9_9FUNG|nr:hypothetical protein BC938DRAFT_477886 [Jimgerdemannia flammicorona]
MRHSRTGLHATVVSLFSANRIWGLDFSCPLSLWSLCIHRGANVPTALARIGPCAKAGFSGAKSQARQQTRRARPGHNRTNSAIL